MDSLKRRRSSDLVSIRKKDDKPVSLQRKHLLGHGIPYVSSATPFGGASYYILRRLTQSFPRLASLVEGARQSRNPLRENIPRNWIAVPLEGNSGKSLRHRVLTRSILVAPGTRSDPISGAHRQPSSPPRPLSIGTNTPARTCSNVPGHSHPVIWKNEPGRTEVQEPGFHAK